MLTLAGKLLIFGGCTAIGVCRAMGLRRRTLCLEQLRSAVGLLERELSFSLPSVEELLGCLERESGEPAAGFFRACREEFQNSGRESWWASWQTALEGTDLPLGGEDRRILGELGRVLGRYDGDSQRRALEELSRRLGEQVADAREQEGRLTRVYLTLGAAAGLFAAILF